MRVCVNMAEICTRRRTKERKFYRDRKTKCRCGVCPFECILYREVKSYIIKVVTDPFVSHIYINKSTDSLQHFHVKNM